ncbi:MAG: hypothetical protein J5529_10945 [Prevotella sp.]|nr:hypothetical protein [Prevotella sp.]
MTIVIADDITGAAEMAGIACSHGLSTSLLTERAGGAPSCEVLVIATDTRSMTEEEAVAELGEWLRWMGEQGLLVRQHTFFKKTDSALRGHVVAELRTMMAAMGVQQACLVPANPSKGRVVRDGVFLIDGVPISRTLFASDPEFPAVSSRLTERFPDAEACGIAMPDADTVEAVEGIMGHCQEDTLMAGAADMFAALLRKNYGLKGDVPCNMGFPASLVSPKTTLVVCGSTQSQPQQWHLPKAAMPSDVYEGREEAASWTAAALPLYDKTQGLLLHIPFYHLTGREVAVRLRHATAEVVAAVVEVCHPAHLVIEGGATAFCCLHALGWRTFSIVRQISPGVVTMAEEHDTLVTLKPGSYPWGDGLHQFAL